MAQIILRDVCKIYDGNVRAVNKANLTIADNEFMVIVGPSGCGKTTTLRMIAGLEEISEGTISIGDKVVNDIVPKDRDIAMVFQNYALYPHMTVFDNMAFGLKLRKYSKADIKTRVMNAAKLLGLEQYLDRKPKALSGGQRQRVALGRAIVRNPKAFLFDEPLSNLDAKLRVTTRVELKALHHRLQTTSVYVTHDQAEAMTLGDRICVMYNGDIQQVASPMEVYDKPVNRFVAGFLGTPPMNFLNGTIIFKEGKLYFGMLHEHIELPQNLKAKIGSYVGKEMILGIRPESISPIKIEGMENNYIEVVVSVVEPLGDRMDAYLTTRANEKLIVNIDPHTKIKVDEKITIYFNVNKIHIFEPGDIGKNISL
ncbi:MAG: sn-glycerol-3-phosphate ABC transporter ATP-binding protein UgpC [Phycisphaerales bacterium]